jgi:hypothetical protein
MSYHDAQSALRYQQIADPNTPSFQRQLLLARREQARLPTPSEIGLR